MLKYRYKRVSHHKMGISEEYEVVIRRNPKPRLTRLLSKSWPSDPNDYDFQVYSIYFSTYI